MCDAVAKPHRDGTPEEEEYRRQHEQDAEHLAAEQVQVRWQTELVKQRSK